jgi:hypothetical protein
VKASRKVLWKPRYEISLRCIAQVNGSELLVAYIVHYSNPLSRLMTSKHVEETISVVILPRKVSILSPTVNLSHWLKKS